MHAVTLVTLSDKIRSKTVISEKKSVSEKHFNVT